MKVTGIIIALLVAINQGNVSVANRNLKNTPVTVILFYHGIIGLVLLWTYIAIEASIKGELRLSNYTLETWLISLISATFSASETLTTTLAY